MADHQDAFQYAMSSNVAWAGYKAHQNPNFFPRMAAGQSPQILWIGCADARCPETVILGLQPGDVFVHRNVGNVVTATDINVAAVVEFAISHLKIKHIVLCGHTSCGGANAALSEGRAGGVLDTWLAPLKALRVAHADELGAIGDAKARAVRMAEINVEAGVQVLMANVNVQEAIQEHGLEVHGVMFDLATGRLRNLGVGTSQAGQAQVPQDSHSTPSTALHVR